MKVRFIRGFVTYYRGSRRMGFSRLYTIWWWLFGNSGPFKRGETVR